MPSSSKSRTDAAMSPLGRGEIQSPRLRLRAATHALLRAELEDPARFAQLVGALVPGSWPPETLREARPVFAGWHREHPDWCGWLDWYAVRVDQGAPVLCGSVGFKGPPDAEGTVEIGYSVLPEHQRAGLATEMVGRLVSWAFGQPGVRSIVAETTMDNRASIRVLEHHSFERIGVGREPGSLVFRLAGPR